MVSLGFTYIRGTDATDVCQKQNKTKSAELFSLLRRAVPIAKPKKKKKKKKIGSNSAKMQKGSLFPFTHQYKM